MKTLLLSGAVFLSGVSGAHADWRSERTSVGPNGGTSQTTRTVTRGENTRVTQVEADRSNGADYSRQVVQVWDPITQSWTRTVIGETQDGNVWTNTGTGSCAGGACNSQSTYVGPNGRSVERQSEAEFDRSGGERSWNWSSNGGRSGEGQRVWQRLR